MKTKSILLILLLLAVIGNPLSAGITSPFPGPTGHSPEDSVSQTLKISQRGWWTKVTPVEINTNGVLPQADSALVEKQTPTAFASVNEPDDPPGFYVYDETPAKLLNLEAVLELLKYPEHLETHQVEGLVMLRLEVDYTGKVIGFQITRSTHSMMSEACRVIVPELQFVPARQAGRSVNSFVTLPIQFELKKGKPK